MKKENQEQINLYADILNKAMINRQPTSAISAADAALNIHDAYAIQMVNIERALAQGEQVSGKKIGLTSLPMQNLLGVNEPNYGHLFQSMNMTGKQIPMKRLLQPHADGEIAFVLKEDIVGPNATVEDVYRATDYVVGAIEIADSRVRDWKITLLDTVADNASAGLYVLGSKKVYLSDISLKDEKMKFYRNGQLTNEGSGSAGMGDPALCVAWLANKLSQFGVVLKKGEVVLSGALSAITPVRHGDHFEVIFSTLGTVTAEFI